MKKKTSKVTSAETTSKRRAKTVDAVEKYPRRAAADTEEVVVTGRPLVAGDAVKKAKVFEPGRKVKGTTAIRVKAIRVGYYGHKRRPIGEVFDMTVGNSGELPAWVIDLADAEPGQDEGTRGLHSGGREDDEIRAERGVSKSRKSKIADPTIINDALPLGQGGNERKPEGGEDHVI